MIIDVVRSIAVSGAAAGVNDVSSAVVGGLSGCDVFCDLFVDLFHFCISVFLSV